MNFQIDYTIRVYTNSNSKLYHAWWNYDMDLLERAVRRIDEDFTEEMDSVLEIETDAFDDAEEAFRRLRRIIRGFYRRDRRLGRCPSPFAPSWIELLVTPSNGSYHGPIIDFND